MWNRPPTIPAGVAVPMPSLADGDYTVSYTYVGPDEHRMSSTLKFRVSANAAAGTATGIVFSPSVLDAAADVALLQLERECLTHNLLDALTATQNVMLSLLLDRVSSRPVIVASPESRPGSVLGVARGEALGWA